MREDFAAFILTHRRPDNQQTLRLLQRSGYTGRTYLIVDDEDPTLEEYRARWGDQVVVFSRAAARAMTDDADHTGTARIVVHARNMCWEIARQVGAQYFIQLDDDYSCFDLRYGSDLLPAQINIKTTLDLVLEAMVEWLESDPRILSVAMSQGGDFIRGPKPGLGVWSRRKAMNSFVCSVDRPFRFVGAINEDVNTYVTLGQKGHIFLTAMQVQLSQATTQAQRGGLTETYLDFGTYKKSFYTVMYEPSCAQISVLGSPEKSRGDLAYYRIHHRITHATAFPCIISSRFKK